jgi:putative endonuclease
MYYTYIIKSKTKKYYYIGSTDNLEKRIKEHNQGKTKSIKHLVPFELIYYEAYIVKSLARKREIELKKNSFKKRELLQRIEE